MEVRTHTPRPNYLLNQTHHTPIGVDEARLLPRYRLAEQATIFSTEFARARKTGIVPTAPTKTVAVPSPGELRGIPVIGHGGAIPGTDPAKALNRSAA